MGRYRLAVPSLAANRRGPLLYAAIAAVAFAVRLVPILRGGGLGFYGRYDDGVYYAAAEGLTFGHAPYRDYLLLHPPGLALVLAPFALLGRATTDASGFAVARLVFMAVGALNAMLVARLAARWGWVAAAVAGLLYACWVPAVYGEQTTLLEPLGTTATMVALLLLCRAPVPSRRVAVAAGVTLGLALALKVWYVVPLLVVVGWQWRLGRHGAARRIVVSAVVAVGVVVIPFFALAPGAMFRMVLRDQVARAGEPSSPVDRVEWLLGVRPLIDRPNAALFVTLIALAVVGAAMLVCSLDRLARVLVGLVGLGVLVLLVSPTFYPHYGELTAAPMAVTVGIGIARIRAELAAPRFNRALLVMASAAVAASGIAVVATPEGHGFAAAAFEAAAPAGCVTADDPVALIEMDRLTSDFAAGCAVPVDVSGITYDRLRASRSHVNESRVNRGENPAWQRYLHDYLFSGAAFVLLRERQDGISPRYLGQVRAAPVLARDGRIVLRAGLNARRTPAAHSARRASYDRGRPARGTGR